MDRSMSKRITFRADQLLDRNLDAEAKEKNVSKSEVVRWILREYFTKKEIERERESRLHIISEYLKKMVEKND